MKVLKNIKQIDMRKIFFIGLILVMLMTACQGPHIQVVSPNVEMQENPLGVATLAPRFSWQLSSELTDVVQLSYRIQVAETKDALKREEILVWDSGVVQGDLSLLIPYAGNDLLSGKSYYWRVKVATNHGETSWSEVQHWSMALSDPSDWQTE